jgi:hypothetical protein
MEGGVVKTRALRPVEARDERLPPDGTQILHAVTVEAPVEEVWPWLAQLGQDRGGFYSYEWLENLAGCKMNNADRVHPEWQHRELGEAVHLHPAGGTGYGHSQVSGRELRGPEPHCHRSRDAASVRPRRTGRPPTYARLSAPGTTARRAA